MDRVALIREHVPDCAITTDIIVGFPGETEEDFARDARGGRARSATTAPSPSSSRPRRGTEAAELDDQVPHPVKVERMERLVEAVQRRARERAQRFVGRDVEVLVEGPSRTDPSRLRGRTPPQQGRQLRGHRDARRAGRGRDRPAPPRRRWSAPRACSRARSPDDRDRDLRPDRRSARPAVAIELAELLRERGEDPVAVSCDAMQVYRGPGGRSAAPPSAEQRERLEHRLLGFVAGRRGVQRRPVRRARPAGDRRACSPPGGGRSSSAAPASTCARRSTELDLRPPVPRRGPGAVEARDRRARARGAARRARPRASADGVHPNDRKRIARALELQRAGIDPPERGGELWTARAAPPDGAGRPDHGPRCAGGADRRAGSRRWSPPAPREEARAADAAAPRGRRARRSASTTLVAATSRP